MNVRRFLISTIFLMGVSACAGKILQVDHPEEVLKTDEYDSKVEIKPDAPPPPEPVIKEVPEKELKKKSKKIAKKSHKKPAKKGTSKVKGPRQPEIEDSEGFDGRRPIVDPFHVGEKVSFDVTYFNINAGVISMAVLPFVTVNGKKAYHFEISGNSNSFFSKIYAVDDKLTTYLSYDEMIPLSLQVSIKESKQLAEARTYFDWKTKRASYWQKRYTKEKGERSKKIDWDLPPFSQNVASVAFYLRTFKLEPGKKLAIRVADEGKNSVYAGNVLRREILKTAVGDLKTVVISPQVQADGEFKPIGDITLWFTDDDQKLLVRLESKIKIGTIVAKLKSIERGQPNETTPAAAGTPDKQ
jgi:hypothetical protein